MRACIVSSERQLGVLWRLTYSQGRPFAWQEILLAVASIVQKFDLSLVDPSYTLELKQALTIKPKGFKIRAALRATSHPLSTPPSSPLKAIRATNNQAQTADGTMPLYVLYGSNTGTSEAFAQRIASDAPAYGQSVSMSWGVQWFTDG